jgi:hypothetical protein
MAASKNRVVLRSNFRAVKGAGHDALAELIEKATDEMERTATTKISQASERRGYNISTEHLEAGHSDDDGWIRFTQFWGRFFEYGTVYIAAMPFMRPAHRAGRKVIKTDASHVFQKWFNRKARIR